MGTSCVKEKNSDDSIRYKNFTDKRDGAIYNYVEIDGQVWMAENLDFVTDSGSWYYDDDANNATPFGRLYNWKTACEVCPEGWHLPSDAEWLELVAFYGGVSAAGGKLKDVNTKYWGVPNEGATNESEFSARGGGYFDFVDGFLNMGIKGMYHSKTENDSLYSSHLSISVNINEVDLYDGEKIDGYSIRCIKD
ncbi:MAG: hypothetical protein JKY42_04450 [Flavobacteriales bacterium]|nr:hypothetical protein [Flavobacteriales bacterium]